MQRLEPPELDAAERLDGEPLSVWRHRYREARAVGLTTVEAAMFADTNRDLGDLRRLVDGGCPSRLLAAILL